MGAASRCRSASDSALKREKPLTAPAWSGAVPFFRPNVFRNPGVLRDISPQTFRGRPFSQTRVTTELDLLQGTLDLLVLKTLTWGPMHGYAVARWIRETTRDELQVEEGALYTALHRMEKRGWIAAEWGVSENNRKARYYKLTAAGRRQLLGKAAAFERYADAVFRVLRTA